MLREAHSSQVFVPGFVPSVRASFGLRSGPSELRCSRGIAQPGSAIVLGTIGRRFESCCPDHECQIAHIGSKPSDRNHRIVGMSARIYRPTRGATQSGQACSQFWVLEFAPEEPQDIDPLMGWTGSGDMKRQIRLRFGSEGRGDRLCAKARHCLSGGTADQGRAQDHGLFG